MNTPCKENRSMCILKEKGVCFRVPSQTGPPPEPTYVRVPYYEFIAKNRMNRTHTCDVFIKGDIVRIYAQDLAKSSNAMIVLTVCKKKNSQFFLYRRKMSEVMKHLPDPTTKEPSYRTVRVEALGYIRIDRLSPRQVSCFKLSLRHTEKSGTVLAANESEHSTSSTTVWVEKSLCSTVSKPPEEPEQSPLLSPQQQQSRTLSSLLTVSSGSSLKPALLSSPTIVSTVTTVGFSETMWVNEGFTWRPAITSSSTLITASTEDSDMEIADNSDDNDINLCAPKTPLLQAQDNSCSTSKDSTDLDIVGTSVQSLPTIGKFLPTAALASPCSYISDILTEGNIAFSPLNFASSAQELEEDNDDLVISNPLSPTQLQCNQCRCYYHYCGYDYDDNKSSSDTLIVNEPPHSVTTHKNSGCGYGSVAYDQFIIQFEESIKPEPCTIL